MSVIVTQRENNTVLSFLTNLPFTLTITLIFQQCQVVWSSLHALPSKINRHFSHCVCLFVPVPCCAAALSIPASSMHRAVKNLWIYLRNTDPELSVGLAGGLLLDFPKLLCISKMESSGEFPFLIILMELTAESGNFWLVCSDPSNAQPFTAVGNALLVWLQLWLEFKIS